MRLGPYLRSGYLRRGRSWDELAAATGLPAGALTATMARFNTGAAEGVDADFGRGASAYDRAGGDPEHEPSPTLGPLTEAPFYAVRIVPGDIGSFLGLRTDAAARVLTADGRPVPGLWAAGSAATPITGGTYPAAGLTIGQAMTFGLLAAEDACAGKVAAAPARAAE